MKSIVSAKKKSSRRYGDNLWGDANSPFNRRSYGPGQHGQRRKKATDYGEQLNAKQKLKVYYGNISEKPCHNCVNFTYGCKGSKKLSVISCQLSFF